MNHDTFTEHDLSRREFVRLSAATGGALALPGNASAAVDSPKFDAEYRYVLNHTPAGYAVPTLVTFSEAAGFEALSALGGESLRTTTTPRPAAYTTLTAADGRAAAEIPAAESFTFSPGANPFWRLGYYPAGVFPEATRSTGYIDYEENRRGLRHLESEHPDRLRTYTNGRSKGHLNYASNRDDAFPILFAELAADVRDRAAFAEKEKLVFTISLHGDERAGVEAGSRFIENVLRGQEPAIGSLLEEFAFVFVYANPDGWKTRQPQYESYGVPGATLFERGQGAGEDTNRQYANAGWIFEGFYPAEPNGRDLEADDSGGIDRDVPPGIRETVPDALWIVETLRGYDNVGYLADLHGQSVGADTFVYGLTCQDQFDQGRFQDVQRWNRTVGEEVTEVADEWRTAAEARESTVGSSVFGVPETAFAWGTIWDTLGYTGTGRLREWAQLPEESGGLGAVAQNFEMAYSNIVSGNVFDPQRVDAQVRAYRAVYRRTIEHAATEVESGIVTGDTTTGYVPSDRLSVDAEDLPFLEDGEYVGGGSETDTDVSTRAVEAGETATVAVRGADAVSVDPRPRGELLAAAELRDPSGETARRYDPREARAADGGLPTWHLTEPAAGEWTLRTEAVDGDGRLDVRVGRVAAAESPPDPGSVDSWGGGYRQRDYGTADALQYFRDYDDYVADDGAVVPVTEPAALDGLDSLVVVHDDVDAAFVEAVDEFVEAGGTLVLTDSGVNLLADLENAAAAPFDADSVDRQELFVPNIGDRNEDHPLLTDTRSIQRQLYNVVAQGIKTDEAPMWLVDPDDFADAGGTAAGETDGRVPAGTIDRTDVDGRLHVVGGLLQPPSQANLHPFGLLDYAVAFLGHTVLTNALGHVQVRSVDGEVDRTFGPPQFESVDPGLGAAGDRDAGSAVQIGDDTVRNRVTLSHEANESLAVRDLVPYEYDVAETGETVVDVEPRRDDGVKVVSIGPDAPAGETLEFDYLVETPASVGTQRRSGTYDLGPAQVRDPDDGEWVDVDGTVQTHVVVAAEPLQND
jgi:hypothetical protein